MSSRVVIARKFRIPPDSYPSGVYSCIGKGGQWFFTIRGGSICTCAPELQYRMDYWLQMAVRIRDL